MAIIKKKTVHELSFVELQKRLGELRLELAKDRGQIAIGGAPANPGRVRAVRRTIARILTELNKKDKGGV